MTRLATLTASALAVAALAVPASAMADHNALRGAPQLFQVDSDTVEVTFATDKKIAKRDARIAVAGGATRKVKADGRHGRDFKYVARVNVDRDLTVGTKYRVRFTFGDDDAIARKALLRDAG